MDNISKEENTEELNDKIDEIENTEVPDSEEIANLKNQIAVLQDQLVRSIAEMDNTRKRLEKAREDAKDYAIVSFAKDLLSVSDNLARALEYKPENLDEGIANIVTTIITGVEMTQEELNKIFIKNNIEPLKPEIGSPFDYNIHNAISQIESEEYAPGSITALMQVGYKIKDRLLRPAAVQVSK